jgi:hypothetical protein
MSNSEELKTALADLASLGRVDHKLALTEAENLERVLNVLLPRLLSRIGSNHVNQHQESNTEQLRAVFQKTHEKLVSMLSHIMKRVREDPTCRLPCEAILNLLLTNETGTISYQASVNSLTLNLSLAFLTLGIPRAESRHAEVLLPGMLVLLANHSGLPSLRSPASKLQANQVAHLVLRLSERLVIEDSIASYHSTPPSSISSSSDFKTPASANLPSSDAMDEVRQLVAGNRTVSQSLYDLLLDVLLYQSSSSATMPPPGLSQSGNDRLRTGSSAMARDWAAEVAVSGRLRNLKLALLDFVAPTRRWAIFMGEANPLGVSRTVALLVATSGDIHSDVADRANSYLKLHLDTMRTKTDDDEKSTVLGNPISIIIVLQRLALGDANAEVALLKVKEATRGQGTTVDLAPSRVDHQLVLSLKRRMVSEKTSAAILSFCAKLLDETPHLLLDLPDALAVGTLSALTASRLLAGYTSGLSALRAAPYISASQLLNALCTRLTASPTVLDNLDIRDIFSQALATSCSVLANAASPRSSSSIGATTVGEGSVTVRDACYGIICSLSRCPEFCVTGRIFGSSTTSASNTSIETATLLFGCTANEEETLRPRAVAALDALLGAYCRVYKVDNDERPDDTVQLTENPWMNLSAQISSVSMKMPLGREILAKALLPLLWNAAQPSKTKASRVAAATWAGKLLKLIDIPNACHLLCCLAGDLDVSAAVIAREGLALDKKIGEPYEATTDMTVPEFAGIARVLFVSTDKKATAWRPRYFDFSEHGKAAALRFGLNCLLNDLYDADQSAIEMYIRALCDTFLQFGTSSRGRTSIQGRASVDLLDECAICLSACVTASEFTRKLMLNQGTGYTIEDLEFLAVCGASSKARRYLAESVGRLYEAYDLWSDAAHPSLDLWVKSCNLLQSLTNCSKKIGMTDTTFSIGEAHGAAFLGAWSIRAFRLRATQEVALSTAIETEQCWTVASEILDYLGRGTTHADEVIANASSHSIGIALSFESIDAPILDSRLYAGVASVLLSLSTALTKYLNGDDADPIRSGSIIKATGTALASSTSAAGYTSDTSRIGQARLECVDALFTVNGSTAFRKDPEVALLAGEALAAYADAYSPKNAVWSTHSDAWPLEFNDEYLHNLPPHEQVLYALLHRDIKSSNNHKRIAVAPALLAVVARAARVVNGNIEHACRALVVEIVKVLPEIQKAFILLLADPRCQQFSRESCCLGLAACQGIAEAVTRSIEKPQGFYVSLKDSMNESLLKAFGQTTSYGGSAMMESQAQNAERVRQENREREGIGGSSTTEPFGIETAEVGGAAGLGEAALGAYREMAAAAVALGRSDVLYALLLLSVSHSVWFSVEARDKYSAAALLGEGSLLGDRTNTVEIRNALRPYIGKLVPRLLRAKHDPNKQTREQMEVLWLGLTGGGAEARQAITGNLLPTIDSLINDAQNKLWRARVGACGALAEVIVARSWDDLGGGGACLEDDEVLLETSSSNISAAIRLLRLWRVAMRAMDDVRQSVRESGEVLARSVKGLTIRLCDPSLALRSLDHTLIGEGNGNLGDELTRAASSTSLRFLVTNGLEQKCPEAAGLCVACLVGVVEVVRPATLEPVLPELVGSLLMAMSGIEPAALNYFQVRAAGRDSSETYDRLEHARIQFAQSGPIAQALNRCLEMVPLVDLATQQSIVPQLDSALRGGAGFATRAATADSVSSLCHSCPSAFKFPGVSSTNPTVRLLRALYFASERERGVAARDKMSHALGNLAALSPGQTVRSLALRACDRYRTATGNDDDPATRRAAAAAVRAIVVRAPNQVVDGGANEVWSSKVLPVAFLGKKDADTKISSLWKEVWDEGGASLGLGRNSGFGTSVEEHILPGLVRECAEALDDVSWARRIAGASSLSDLCDIGVLTPIARQTADSLSTQSSAELERARRRAKAAYLALKSCVSLVVKPRIWTGKTEVVKATTKLAAKWILADDLSHDKLGWTEQSPCPWLPISVGPRSKSIDLFEGDSYFEEPTQDMAGEEWKGCRGGDLGDESGWASDSKIDFVDEDKLVRSTNPDLKDEADGKLESSTVSFRGLCRALVSHALPHKQSRFSTFSHEEFLPFKAASLEGTARLLNAVKLLKAPFTSKLSEEMYLLLTPRLLTVIDSEGVLIKGGEFIADQPPLIVARAIQCFGAVIWNGIGLSGEPFEDVMRLAKLFQNSGGAKQGAWTVREAAFLGASDLVSVCPVEPLRHHQLLSGLLSYATSALQDRKFWRVRVAGLVLMQSLISRAGTGNNNIGAVTKTASNSLEGNHQLMLEALLPFKEDILQTARSALKDAQSEVSATASQICGLIAWWP